MINLETIKKHLPKRRLFKLMILMVVLIIVFVALKNIYKKMPEGTNFVSKTFVAKSADIHFLSDLSYEKDHEKHYEQNIFDTIIKRIEEAEHYILIDMFLFNSQLGNSDTSYRSLSNELVQAIVKKIKENPEIKIDFITDPINIVYGGYKSKEIDTLRQHGVNVIITNLKPLRDSNPIWSSIYRTFFAVFSNSDKHGWLKNPFGKNDTKVSLRSWLNLLNFKANHRKVFVSDRDGEMTTIVSSANPHDGSSAHSNSAIEIRGDFWQSVWFSEQAVAKLSNAKLSSPPILTKEETVNNGDANVTIELITEEQIKKSLVEAIDNSKEADQITMGMFYLADRDIINALIDASKRDVEIKIILDPNKDAFGYKKIGIPNRQVAYELMKESDNKIQIRWYDTHGEQFHTKLTYFAHRNGPSRTILGSANLTRRNIGNYNLETNVSVIAHGSTVFTQDVHNYLKKIWENAGGIRYTTEYETYKDESNLKYLIYVIQELSGLSSF